MSGLSAGCRPGVEGVGPGPPLAHDLGDPVDVEAHQRRDHSGFVFGEEVEVPLEDLGQDDVDGPAGEHPGDRARRAAPGAVELGGPPGRHRTPRSPSSLARCRSHDAMVTDPSTSWRPAAPYSPTASAILPSRRSRTPMAATIPSRSAGISQGVDGSVQLGEHVFVIVPPGGDRTSRKPLISLSFRAISRSTERPLRRVRRGAARTRRACAPRRPWPTPRGSWPRASQWKPWSASG